MVDRTFIFDCEVFAHDWLFVFKDSRIMTRHIQAEVLSGNIHLFY